MMNQEIPEGANSNSEPEESNRGIESARETGGEGQQQSNAKEVNEAKEAKKKVEAFYQLYLAFRDEEEMLRNQLSGISDPSERNAIIRALNEKIERKNKNFREIMMAHPDKNQVDSKKKECIEEAIKAYNNFINESASRKTIKKVWYRNEKEKFKKEYFNFKSQERRKRIEEDFKRFFRQQGKDESEIEIIENQITNIVNFLRDKASHDKNFGRVKKEDIYSLLLERDRANRLTLDDLNLENLRDYFSTIEGKNRGWFKNLFKKEKVRTAKSKIEELGNKISNQIKKREKEEREWERWASKRWEEMLREAKLNVSNRAQDYFLDWVVKSLEIADKHEIRDFRLLVVPGETIVDQEKPEEEPGKKELKELNEKLNEITRKLNRFNKNIFQIDQPEAFLKNISSEIDVIEKSLENINLEEREKEKIKNQIDGLKSEQLALARKLYDFISGVLNELNIDFNQLKNQLKNITQEKRREIRVKISEILIKLNEMVNIEFKIDKEPRESFYEYKQKLEESIEKEKRELINKIRGLL